MQIVETTWVPVTGDTARSFDDYVRTQQLSLVRYATLLSGSVPHAEDLVQDVLTRLYPRWDRLTAADGDLHAYVRRSVTNQYLSWLRRWSTRHIHPVDHSLLEHAERSRPPQQATPDGPDEDLWEQLLDLTPKQRAAIVLRFYEGLSDAEIAEILRCREGTVRSHISRGLAVMRTALALPPSTIRPGTGEDA